MSKEGFNLLRSQLTSEDKWEKVYEWVNNTARIVIILVELVVVLCFGARVVVDRQAKNLEEVLDRNVVILESLETVEKEIRQLQADLTSYNEIWDSSSNYAPFLEEVFNYNLALFDSYSISMDSKGKLRLVGKATRSEVSELENAMKSSPSYSLVQLSNYKPGEGGDNSLGEFGIQADIREFTRTKIKLEEENENQP